MQRHTQFLILTKCVKVLLLVISVSSLTLGDTYAQEAPTINSPSTANEEDDNSSVLSSTTYLAPAEKDLKTKISVTQSELKQLNIYRNEITGMQEKMEETLSTNLYRNPQKREYRFDPIKSINNNIKFGGFNNGKVDLYFAPMMNIKPFDGVSIFATRHRHLYIPIESIQENVQSLAIETVGIVILENLVDYVTIDDNVLNGLLNFSLKNGLSFIISSILYGKDELNEKQIGSYDYYYFSTSIRF